MRHIIFLLCLFSLSLAAQPFNAPLNSANYTAFERLSVLQGLKTDIHPAVKPFSKQDLTAFTKGLLDSNAFSGDYDLRYLRNEYNLISKPDSIRRKRPWNRFFSAPAHFAAVREAHFRLFVNPIIHVGGGRESGDETVLFTNRRGLELSGDIDQKLWFYTNLVEQQMVFPNYVTARIGQFKSIPGAGFYKPYNSRLFKVSNGFDYNVAQAYIGFNASKHIGLQFGHGNHFIGNGYRSLLLSDFGNNAFFLKVNTRVWRFHYQNLFMELTPFSKNAGVGGDLLLLKKYAAMHFLDLRIGPRMSIGFFEATIFNRGRQFEFQYLNPVILYRSVEGMIGSPDNVLVGLNGHWDLFKRLRLYGQFMLDEFVFKEFFKPEQPGWWGNKYGIQTGLKYFNAFGIKRLDLQLEYNSARPYTYAHSDSLDSYTHYSHPLAHPLGANFREYIALARYTAGPRLRLGARMLYMQAGEDAEGQNWGGNPFQSYLSREMEYNNKLAQGIGANTLLLGLDASWMLFHNAFLDFKLLYRSKVSEDISRDRKATLISAGFRWNFYETVQDF